MGIAVLRYRLYEIDLLINRTLVYVPLTAILAGLYIALTGGLRTLVSDSTGRNSDANIALTTVLVVALLTPVKNFLQEQVDRWFKPARAGPSIVELNQRILDVVSILDFESVARRAMSEAVQAFGARGGALDLEVAGARRRFEQGDLSASPLISFPIPPGTGEAGTLSIAMPESAPLPPEAQVDDVNRLLASLAQLLAVTNWTHGFGPRRAPKVGRH